MRNLLAVMVVGLVAASSFGTITVTTSIVDPGTGLDVQNLAAVAGTTYEMDVFAQGDVSGVLAMGGDIVPSVALPGLQTVGNFNWVVSSNIVAAGTSGNIAVPAQGGSFAGALPTPIYNKSSKGAILSLAGWTFPSSATVAGQVAQTIDAVTPNPVAGVAGWGGWNQGGVATAGGGMGQLGSGQAPGAALDASFGASGPAWVGYYLVKVTQVGNTPVTLNWVDAPLVGGTHVGYGGWYTVGTTAGDWALAPSVGATFTNIAPEPATMALLALGGMLIARRRRA